MPTLPCLSFGKALILIIVANIVFAMIGTDCGGEVWDDSDPSVPLFNRPIIKKDPNALCYVRGTVTSIIAIIFLLGFVFPCK
jgi:hypothetical protein